MYQSVQGVYPCIKVHQVLAVEKKVKQNLISFTNMVLFRKINSEHMKTDKEHQNSFDFEPQVELNTRSTYPQIE